MLKILGLGAALLIIVATLSVGTWAYFSDTETVSTNTVTAGTLILTVDDGTPVAFDIGDTYPSDKNNAATWNLKNDGSIAGWLKITTGALDDGGGELDSYLKLLLWVDLNRNGKLNTGDKVLKSTGITPWAGTDDILPTSVEALTAYELATALDGTAFGTSGSPVLSMTALMDTAAFRAEYLFPDNDADQNDAQGDAVTMDLTFTLVQTGATGP